jgi:hypothetical protein
MMTIAPGDAESAAIRANLDPQKRQETSAKKRGPVGLRDGQPGPIAVKKWLVPVSGLTSRRWAATGV